MSVLVAVFNETTSWSARTITYEEAQRQFILQDHGPITAQSVLGYDAQGQLDWARDGLREWVRDFADWEFAHRPQGQAPGQTSSEAEGPARDAASGTSRGIVTSGARSPHRRSYKKLEIVGLLAAFVIVIAIVATAHHSGSGSGSASSSGGGTASPSPVTKKITDPGVTLSPAITKFVTVIGRADQHAYSAWMALNSGGLGAFKKQYGVSAENLRAARALQPSDDGSKQWRLARRYASVMTSGAKYENRAVQDALANNWVAEHRDFVAFKTRMRRVQHAHDAYFAYASWQNWAGYCAVGRRFTSVTATWTQPQVQGNGAADRRVDIWVGLDGGVSGSPMCEQTGIGIFQKATDPGADYWAWYEMLPKPPVKIATSDLLLVPQDLVVKAGDTVTATVTRVGNHRFRLTLVDSTRSERSSVIETNRHAKCASAEIIVEAHLRNDLSLADFDPVHFTDCAVDGRPLTAFHWNKSNATAIGNLAMTSTSALKDEGTSFTVTRR
jgi:hypothetical protein